MEISSDQDPYEQKLYQMFKSYDAEASGALNESSLIKLCNSLELKDEGAVLIRSLIKHKESRVTFKEFKEALLNFLGTEMDHRKEKSLVISDDDANTNLDSQPDLSDREVSPKFIVGSKKYGRRSRPQSLVTDSSPSDSDEADILHIVPNIHQKSQKVLRSTSQTDIPGSRRRRPNLSGTKLKRCASLPAQKNPRNKQAVTIVPQNHYNHLQQQPQKSSSVESLGNLDFENLTNKIHSTWMNYGNEIGTYYFNSKNLRVVFERVGIVEKIAGKVADEVFEKLNSKAQNMDVINLKQFIELIHGNSLNQEISDAIAADICFENNGSFKDSKDTPAQLDTIPIHSVLEMWERVNIPEPKQLLQNLGFDEDSEINLTELSKVLEDELQSIGIGPDDESQTMLLKAALAIQKAEVSALQQTYRHLVAENKKLYSDNKDANRRAVLLAQEVDERHAHLEDATKSEIRLLEQRHAEAIRDISAQLSNDRESWSNLNSRHESHIKTLEQDEVKLKTEIQSLRSENSALEKEQITLQKQVTDLLETNIKLNNTIVDIDIGSVNDSVGAQGTGNTEEVLELINKITVLQVENSNLRDKNDELVAEVEGLTFEISRNKIKPIKVGANLDDDVEHSLVGGVKRRGDSPSKTQITEESPRLGKFRKCNSDIPDVLSSNENDTSGEWIALNSELQNPVVTPTSTCFPSISRIPTEDMSILKEKLSQLEAELKEYKEMQTKEKDTSECRCKELESSLDLMRKAYEDCEDYWQDKLSDERKLFDKERHIYEEEQQESDKKFTELMEKVREYEEQFSKDGRLSPIEEKDNLEQQYIDLETEMEEVKDKARSLIDEKSLEIDILRSEVESLRNQVHENEEIFGEMNKSHKHLNQENLDMVNSPASSPISYLMNQSTIQAPATCYQSENDNLRQTSRFNLSTSETTIFSTHVNSVDGNTYQTISPIQKPVNKSDSTTAPASSSSKDNDDTSSIASRQSFETQSVASTHSIHKAASGNSCLSPNGIKEELKRLKFFEVQLKEQIKDLAIKRDSLVMELQQLQEAKPVLEKAYARTAHPSLIQRVNQMELRNRHLQNVIKQQQSYTENLMHQTWQQHHAEISEIHNRLESQGMMLSEQAQRLANADILVKELYVENSHLTAQVQRLEQQRSRANIMQQHQHHQGLTGLSGMP